MPKIFFSVLFVLIATISLGQSSKLVRGKIVDQKTSREIEELKIQIQNVKTKKIRKTETDDDGFFNFKNVPFGTYVLKVTDKDYENKTLNSFTLKEEHADNYTFDEKRPFTVSLKVTWMFNWGDWNVKEHYCSHLLAKIILSIYGICLLLIFFYSVLQLSLSIAYAKTKGKRANEKTPDFDIANAPKVTIQLPMFNELYVAERIIETTAAFNYPKDKLEIQVLDDSTDETVEVIAKKVAEIAATGVNIKHIHRVDRTGYKAGALDAAMDRVEGEFIAIFDSDFVPDKDFLLKTIPFFQDPNIGVVQTRWGHLNKDYSILTELQAFGLNGHFAIEQGERNSSGHFINFNGTDGICSKTCIEATGGCELDLLTADLDLLYKAQMKGWKFKYLENVISPAELPITMSALKNQQHRWMKGGAECFIKMRKRIIKAENVKLGDKIHEIGRAHV